MFACKSCTPVYRFMLYFRIKVWVTLRVGPNFRLSLYWLRVECGKKDQYFWPHPCNPGLAKKSSSTPSDDIHNRPPSTYRITGIISFFHLYPSPLVVPQGTHVPYQPQSKKTAAGSDGLPGIRLREGRKESREAKGGGKGKRAMSRVGGEVRSTGRNCEDDERGAGAEEATRRGGRLLKSVCV